MFWVAGVFSKFEHSLKTTETSSVVSSFFCVFWEIGWTLSVALCKCERSFCVMRGLRLVLRKWLTVLAIMNIPQNHPVSYTEVGKSFLFYIQKRSMVIIWLFSLVKTGSNIFIGSIHREVFFGSIFSSFSTVMRNKV